MRTAIVCGLALALAGSVAAAPNVASTTQKGSLLIFPDIDVRGSVSTIVRIQNDANTGVLIKCHYQDKSKQRNDFGFLITRGQPVWFDAVTGAGTVGANPFPAGVGAGFLVCYAVAPFVSLAGQAFPEAYTKHNHLSGTATVVDYGAGTAYEYAAWSMAYIGPWPSDRRSFWFDPDYPDEGSDLLILGGAFDSCPTSLVGQFSPEGALLSGQAEVGRTRAVFALCSLDLRQRYFPLPTKLTFDVWNENELKLTGAHDCADSWYETFLTDLPVEGNNFSLADLKTDVARYRVTPTKDVPRCGAMPADTFAWPQFDPPGVIGVQATEISLDGGTAKAGTHLTGVGRRSGLIIGSPFFGTTIEEGTVR